MGCGNLMLHAARSRKSSCFVPSKDCLSNSAAAADAHAEQRSLSYRCNCERQRRKREVSSSYDTITAMFCERVVKGCKFAYCRSALRKCKNAVFAGVLSPISFAVERNGAVGGSEPSAAGGGYSEVSEWQRSKFQAPAVRQRRNFGHRNSAIIGRPQAKLLRSRDKKRKRQKRGRFRVPFLMVFGCESQLTWP